ncbi:MAG: GyrI-like domain-containing protein [Acidimicrobiales bacterium]|nr:GyrI-like domain-containing protein [Acidimicrobiales bacterium]
MSYTVQVDEVAPQLVAAVRVRTGIGRIGDDIGAGFGRLMQTLASEGVEPAGSPFIVYHDVIGGDADGDIELCIPITRKVDGDEEVSSREIGGGTVAATVHQGSYEEVGSAHHALNAWIAEHGRGAAGPPREIYLNDPRTVVPDELMTRVEFPVRAVAAPADAG